MQSILIVDDDASLQQGLAAEIAAAGFGVRTAANADEAMSLVNETPADLIITDLSMPRGDGFRLIEAVRRGGAVPIIVLSVRDGESDKIRALDLGADDYVTKPFSVAEVLARVRAQLRRSAPRTGNIHRFGELVIDLERKLASRGESELHLTPTEFSILSLLIRRAGRPVTTGDMIREVWAGARGTTAETVRVHVSSLRRKIEPDPAQPQYIVTEPWVGYRFIAEPAPNL